MPTSAVTTSVPVRAAHESSTMRSNRDSDDAQQLWKKYNALRTQLLSVKQANDTLVRRFEMIRRRILGGAGGAGGTGTFRGEYDPSAVYAVQDIVVISLGANQGTFCCVSPVSGVAPYVAGGFWIQWPGGLLAQWM